jgi:hypothetical protein
VDFDQRHQLGDGGAGADRGPSRQGRRAGEVAATRSAAPLGEIDFFIEMGRARHFDEKVNFAKGCGERRRAPRQLRDTGSGGGTMATSDPFGPAGVTGVTMLQADFDALTNVLLPFAKEMLSKHKGYFPFGATISTEGTLERWMADPGDNKESNAIVEVMVRAFHSQAKEGKVRATGMCMDVKTVPPGESEKVDAIRIHLEHSAGRAVEVIVPYGKGWFGSIKYRQPYLLSAACDIFRASE